MLVLVDCITFTIVYCVAVDCVYEQSKKLNFDIVRIMRESTWNKFVFRDYPVSLAKYMFCWIVGRTLIYCLPRDSQFTIFMIIQLFVGIANSIMNFVRHKIEEKDKYE